jgi:hypothetical protein
VPYQSQNTGRITDLLMEPGRIAAQAALQKGQAWAGAAQNIGQTASRTLTSLLEERQQAPARKLQALQVEGAQRQADDVKALDAAYQQPDRESVLAAVPGHLKATVTKQFQDADEQALRLKKTKEDIKGAEADYFGGLGYAIQQHAYDPTAAALALDHAKATYADDPAMLQQIAQIEQQIKANPDALKPLADHLVAGSQKYATLTETSRGHDNAEATLKETTRHNQELERIQGLAQGRADALQKETERHNQAMEKRPVAGAGGAQDTSNVKETVLGMKDGTLPPLLPGRASKEYVELMAEAHRQGFDLAGAATDWMATQKHIASLNSNQQLRLNQAINQLPELLDSIDGLAAKWKGGRFPILNRANLALAKGGVYGPEVASVANQLDAQIADVTGDLGAVYMGGNSPTDHALGLAQKALSTDWDQKVLTDMTALARKNVQTRKHSINNTGVAGASAENPYAPPPAAPASAPAAPAGMVRVKGPNGETGSMPAGSALPPGWLKQ